MADKKTRGLSVPRVDDSDCALLINSGVTITIFIRECIKDKADKIRAIEKKKKRELKKLEL